MAKIPAYPLPQIIAPILVRDPSWVAPEGKHYNDPEYYKGYKHIRDFPVEVLTVNFQSGTMRVRGIGPEFTQVVDISASYFFAQYKVVPKNDS